MLRRTRKVVGWTLGILGFVFSIAKPMADWIGRSTILDDASELVRKMSPAIEFLQRQPDLWFYGFQAALIVTGLVLVFWRRISSTLWNDPQTEAPSDGPKKEKAILPATIEELSKSDFPECMKISRGLTIKGAHKEGVAHLCINWQSHSKFLVVYLPFTEHIVDAIRELATEGLKVINLLQGSMQVFSKDLGDISDVDMVSIPFVNRVVVYYEGRLSLPDAAKLIAEYTQKDLTLVLRGSDYSTQRWLITKAEGSAHDFVTPREGS